MDMATIPTAAAAAVLQANLVAGGANTAAVAPGAAATTAPDDQAANKNAPHLHSVASSLRSCLDGMLPDTLRNDAAAFHQHRASLALCLVL